MTFDKMTFDKMTFDKMTFDKMTFDKMTFDKMTFNKMTFDKMTYDKMTFDDLGWRCSQLLFRLIQNHYIFQLTLPWCQSYKTFLFATDFQTNKLECLSFLSFLTLSNICG
jgi:hypothetical protein